MNGFAMIAESYKRLVKQGEMTEEQAKRSIEIYEFLATCNQDDFCQMVDSSAFNDIIRAFLAKVIDNTKLDEKSKDSVTNELRCLFDDLSAKDVLTKYS
jgi:polyhydroxyalkanoate synthesis regulator phasin